MSQELTGTCDCGAIHYSITGPVRLIVNCHCHSCRKRNGSPYSTYCVVAQNDFNIQQGQDSLATYQNTEGGKKHFCRQCGSPLYNINPRYPGLSMVLLGSISDSTNLKPAFNVYCESKLPWVELDPAMKSFTQAIER